VERVLGIGGHFLRAADPAALGAWYRDCLGLDADEQGLWRQEAGPTVFATFESGTGYFGSPTQQVMIAFRVRDLDAMLAQLHAKGADVLVAARLTAAPPRGLMPSPRWCGRRSPRRDRCRR
jgi:predicted enzyme related to lactoylglutathione lyase